MTPGGTALTVHDETEFTQLVANYRPELQLHCYRMLGSYDESEDLVQETFLRAWRSRESRRDPGSVRAWLYRIATNACLDVLKRNRRRPRQSDEDAALPPAAVPWLQPYPDHLLEQIPAGDAEPHAAVVTKETIELAFLAAIQLLPPRQRAALVLRDVQGWSARETAQTLEASVASVNSALQRARATLREHLPDRRTDWSRSANPSDDERAVLQRYMEAIDRADDAALSAVLSEDVRVGHQAGAGGHVAPDPTWYQGRATVIAAWEPILHVPDAPEIKMVPTRANRQPAVATYIRESGGSEFRAFALAVLRVEDGAVAELTVFVPDVFPSFGLPATV